MWKNTAKKFIGIFALVCVVWSCIIIGAWADTIPGDSGTWLSDPLLTYSYSGDATTSSEKVSTKDATSSVSVTDNVMTVKATSGTHYTDGDCSSTTYYASTVTTTVTVTNSSGKDLQITKLTLTGDCQITGAAEGGTLAAGASFTITVTAKPESATATDSVTATGTVTIEVTDAPEDVTVTFVPVSNIGSKVPGSYTVTSGGTSFTVGETYQTTKSTEFTLSATVESEFQFTGWYVNGMLVSSDISYTGTFKNETNTVSARFDSGDPLAKITVLNTTDTDNNPIDGALTRYDYAEFDSFYTPAGYSTINAGQSYSAFTLNGNPPSCYSGPISGTDNKWQYYAFEDPAWQVSNNTTINSSYSGTAESEDAQSFSQVWAYATVNSPVLRIKALRDLVFSFDYSTSMTSGNGSGCLLAYYIGTSADANLSTIKGSSSIKLLDGSASGSDSGVSISVPAGSYLYLYEKGYFVNKKYASSSASMSFSYSATISNAKITPENKRCTLKTGFQDNPGNPLSGKIALTGTAYTVSNGLMTDTYEDVAGTTVALSVNTAPTGYVHIGWRDITAGKDIYKTTYTITLNEDYEVYALFAPAQTIVAGGTNGYGSANYSDPGQYVARNSDATKCYTTLDEAFNDTNVVVLLAGHTLSGSFTVPGGKTLVIPYALDDEGSTTAVQASGGAPAMRNYCAVSLNGSLTVDGTLVVNGRQYASSMGITGSGIGRLNISSDSVVTVNGTLCAYGAVVGGTVDIGSTGTVYELMEIRDMPGIWQLYDGYTHAFPFNQFYIKSIESDAVYHAGAKLYAHYSINVGIASDDNMLVLGGAGDTAMFKVSSGTLTKYYDRTNDQNVFRVDKDGSISTGTVSISMTVGVGTMKVPITIDTEKYYMPLCRGYRIEVAGDMTLNNNFKMLPGAKLDVLQGGTLTIAGNLAFYRACDYDTRSYGKEATAYQGFAFNGYPVARSNKFPSLQYNTFDAATSGSAKINVDGTVIVTGGLYVTNGSETFNTNGYNHLTGTGEIRINNLGSATSINEYQRSVGNEDHTGTQLETTVAVTTMKGLTNYDATSDGHNSNGSEYTTLTNATWYGLINDSGVNIWSTTRPVTLIYDANGGTGTVAPVEKLANTVITLASEGYTKPGYSLLGWDTNPDVVSPTYSLGEQMTLSADTTLYAIWAAIPATAPSISTQPSDLSLIYGYSNGYVSVSASSVSGHTLSYQWYSNTSASNSDGTAISGATGSSYTIPTGKNADTKEYYYCVVTAVRTENGQTASATSDVATVTVGKAPSSVTIAPTAITGLTYSGSEQALVTAGEATGGTMQYRLGPDGVYGPAIPTATEAGSYTVYYKVIGDSNHYDSAEESLTVTISNIISVTITWDDLSYTYTYGAWQPESHTYADDTLEWNGATETQKRPQITITNQSRNVALEAKLAYTGTNASFSGSFSAVGGTTLANGNTVSLPTPTNSDATYVVVGFKLSGTLVRGTTLDDATVGTITVTISKPDEGGS